MQQYVIDNNMWPFQFQNTNQVSQQKAWFYITNYDS